MKNYLPVFKKDNKTYLAHEPIYNKKNILLDCNVIKNHAIEVKPISITKNKNAGDFKLYFSDNDIEQLNYQNEIVNKKVLGFNQLTNNTKYKLTKYVSEISSNKYLTYNLLLNSSCNTDIIHNYKNSVAQKWLNIKFGVAKLFLNHKIDLDLVDDLTKLINTTAKQEKELLINLNHSF